MKLPEARLLIRNTFENPFDKQRFSLFIRNLLKDDFEEKVFVNTGKGIPEAFAGVIRKMEVLGKYVDEDGNIIDILTVELKKGHSIEWARTTQRNFIRRYLNGSRGELKDAALVAFYAEDSSDWRFSLIKMQYSLEKKADDLTPARRFSFLVGQDEKSHTAQNQLAKLLTLAGAPTLTEIESSFNIETVTKEFFEKYRELFLDLNEHIEKEIKKSKQLREEFEKEGIDSAKFSKKLLGQIVFLYFLQKKGWLGVPKNENWDKGDKHFLRTLLTQSLEGKKNFFSDYLVYLFYEALATEKRGSTDPSFYPKLNCRIPFLNGGLFEADFNWKKIEINLPNKLFTNKDESGEGDIGTGILDIFDRYNFTVKEDEPLDKEVAVDPEMLGKVFENLLEIKDRKSKGAFYTPREIVHYMCQETLIAYLDHTVNAGHEPIIERKNIEKFIREGIAAIEHDELKEAGKLVSKDYALPESIRNHAEALDQALADIRICDPAIGSGAFPVGMMNEIVKAREILSVYLKNVKSKERTAYELKRHAIQECIYGVDIDHSAIDIAKLRLWLSLVVDEEDFYKIKPLPNLDYKIICGNSLIGYPFEPRGLEKIENIKVRFFELTDQEKKDEYRQQIDNTIHSFLKDTQKNFGYKVDFDFKIHFSEVFHHKKGFDVIIGNPPYVGQKGNKELFQEIKNTPLGKSYHQRRMDLFYFFFHCGLHQLRNGGILSFISTNYYLTATYADKLRKHLYDDAAILSLVNFNELRVFESATGQHNLITSLRKGKNENTQALTAITRRNGVADESILIDILNGKDAETDYYLQPQDSIFEEGTLYIRIEPNGTVGESGSGNIHSVLKKMREGNQTLEEYCFIEQGIVSGADKVSDALIAKYPSVDMEKGEGIYILTDKEIKAKAFTAADKSYLKRTYKNSDLEKWAFNPDDSLYVLYIKSTGKYFEVSPKVKAHLDKYKLILINRNVRVGSITEKDYEKFLKDKMEISYIMNASSMKAGNYYCLSYPRRGKDTFEVPKIVNSRRAYANIFAYEDQGFYEQSDLVVTTLKPAYHNKLSLYYILGILNSKLLYQWFYHKGKRKGELLELFQKPISEVPIKYVEPKQQSGISKLVEKIVDSKKQNPHAEVSRLEKQLDIMVYHLYDLDYNDAKMIDASLTEEEFKKYT